MRELSSKVANPPAALAGHIVWRGDWQGPFSPWLRLAHASGHREPVKAPRTVLRMLLDHEFVLILSGQPWIWFEPLQRSLTLQTGDLIWIPPGLIHGWGLARESHLAVHFDLYAQPELDLNRHIERLHEVRLPAPDPEIPLYKLSYEKQSLHVPAIRRLSELKLWRERLMRLCQLHGMRHSATCSGRLESSALLARAMLEFLHMPEESPVLAQHQEIQKLLSRLEEPHKFAFGPRPEVAELAAYCGMCPTGFRQYFKEVTGISPAAYLERQRLECAAKALRSSGLSIKQIADRSGYPDPYHFSRAFKRIFGASPRTYRAGQPK